MKSLAKIYAINAFERDVVQLVEHVRFEETGPGFLIQVSKYPEVRK